MQVKLPTVNIKDTSDMKDVKNYLIDLVGQIERAFLAVKEEEE